MRRLLARRSARASEGRYVAEGMTLLQEALDAGAPIEAVYAAPGAPGPLLDRALASGARVFDLAPGVMERLADAASPQPVLTVLVRPDPDVAILRDATLVLVCAGLRDPGNAGTVLRSARAAGADGAIFCATSVDPYNPKTVRASAGALLHLPVVEAEELGGVVDRLGDWGFVRLAAVARGGRDYAEVDLTRRIALLVGNEAHGLAPEQLATVDELVTIPMAAHTESLNVGVATGIICFEAARQRRGGRRGSPDSPAMTGERP